MVKKRATKRAAKKKAAKKKAAKKKARKKKPVVELTSDEIAVALGVSDRQVRRYFRQGCPRTSIAAAKKWRSQNIEEIASATEDVAELNLELKKAELKKTLEATRAQKLKTDLLEGTLVVREEIERDIAIAFQRIVNRLKPLGTECANLAPAELKAAIKRKVDETVRVALKELSESV